MPQEENNISIRSDEVQEILGAVPNWMIRWGITLIFLVIILLLFLSWFIKYPDVISGKIVVTTEQPPIKVVTKSTGKLVTLFKNEGENVNKDEEIASIENSISGESSAYLNNLIPLIHSFLKHQNQTLSFNDSDLNFGNIQTSYNSLKKQCLDFNNYKKQDYKQQSIQKLASKLKHYKELSLIANRQITISETEFANAKEKFAIDLSLFKKEVISKSEFFEKQSAFRQKQQNVENLKRTLTQNQITIVDLEKQILDLKFQNEEKERNFKENILLLIDEIQNHLIDWKQNFLLTAPISGKLSFLSTLNKNQFVKTGENLFSIVPQNQNYIGYIEIPSKGFGKVKTNQIVRIRLDNYPYHEYGQVEGFVESISLIPKEDLYRAKIALPKGLLTSYHKTLDFKPEMSGQAEIITEDLRLIERLFNSFRKLFDK